MLRFSDAFCLAQPVGIPMGCVGCNKKVISREKFVGTLIILYNPYLIKRISVTDYIVPTHMCQHPNTTVPTIPYPVSQSDGHYYRPYRE
jgi:hypothetical protein